MNTLGRVVVRLAGALAAVAAPHAARADYALNFQQPVTEIAHEVYDLHMLIFWVCVVIFVAVFSVMFYSVFKHRKSKGHKASTFHESTAIEVVWTIVPFLILVGMAIPSTATLLKMEDTSNSDLTVKITGFQWKWQYEYPEQGVKYFSTLATPRDQIENKAAKDEHYLLEVDNPIVLPVNKKVRFLITANDVIHAWWVPQLAIKKDAIPGFINEVWTKIDKEGTYRGQCAELCGKDHGFMPIVVQAVSEEKFRAWADEQKQMVAAAEAAAASGKTYTMEEQMERGGKIYAGTCAACHGAEGKGVPNVFPALAGSKIATGPLDGHLDIVLHGKQGTAMQAFGAQMNDLDIAAVVTFERNSFGNKTGDVVQAADVKAHRK